MFRSRARVVAAATQLSDDALLSRLERDPDWFLGAGAEKVLKDDTATIALIREKGTRLVIKRYNTRGPLHLCRNALRKTRAQKSWNNAHKLLAVGIETATPIAVIERGLGPFRISSYYVSEFVEGAICQEYFTAYEDEDTMKTLATRIARMFRVLRDNRIRHGDMKAKNIIIRNQTPVLIDLDGLRAYRTEIMFHRVRTKDARRFIQAWLRWPSLEILFRRVFETEGLLA